MSSSTLTLEDKKPHISTTENVAESKKKNNDPFKVYRKDAEFGDNTSIDEEVLFDQPAATKWELWSYYLYYNGVCGFFVAVSYIFCIVLTVFSNIYVG